MSPSTPPRETSVPGVPEPPWARRDRRSRPRRQPLTVETLVDATLAIIREEGVDAVTMRRLAADLRVAPSSLYAHIRTREELLDLANHTVMSRVPDMPDTGDWKADLRTHWLNVQRALSQYGDLAVLNLASVPRDLESYQRFEAVLQRLVNVGISPQVAAWGIDRISLYTFADIYEGWLFKRLGFTSESASTFVTEVRDFMKNLPPEQFPVMSANTEAILGGSSEERYVKGLDMLLDGIEATIDTPAPPSQ